jgi:outer membrane protein
MKTIRNSLCVLLAFGASALGLMAQPAPKILVVDMATLYDGHYKTQEQTAKLQADEQKAQEDLEKLNAEGNTLVKEYQDLVEQAKNPALSDEAKNKVGEEAQRKLEQIQGKQNEVQNFRTNIQRSLQTRIQTFRSLMLEEIGKIAADVAKGKGATLLIDKSGPSLIGISNFLYVDPSYDITTEVAALVNRDRPADMAAPASAAPAPAATSTTSGSGVTAPSVSFPGAGK